MKSLQPILLVAQPHAPTQTPTKAGEVKDYRSHKVYLSKDIEREILMDLKLLESGRIEKVKWVFLGEGPSGPLRELLNTVVSNGKKIEVVP